MDKDPAIVGRLSKLYILALTVMAVLIIGGELFMQHSLQRQTGDSRVVNIAGRQRMLSQKLTKEAMRIQEAREPAEREEFTRQLSGTLQLWQKSYQGLLNGDPDMGLPGGNSAKVLAMFVIIEEPFERMVDAALEIINSAAAPGNFQAPGNQIRAAASVILMQEPLFLKGMDGIVFQYDQEAKSRIKQSERKGWMILSAALWVLLLEGLFIFRPAVRGLSRTLANLKKEQEKTWKLADQLQAKNLKLDEAFREILEISEQERRRFAQDLHDSLSQELSGIACMAKALQQRMEGKEPRSGRELEEISRLLGEAVAHTREIARGLYPITVDGDGLIDRLKDLSAYVEKVFEVRCRLLSGDQPLPVQRQEATHLYCITQEAIHNSIRHGKARSIDVTVRAKDRFLSLSISDDGVGFPAARQDDQGLGIRIMKYRSELINGRLDFSKNQLGGITVTCEISRDFRP